MKQKEYRDERLEEHKEYCKEYYEDHKDEMKQQAKQYYKEHRVERLIYNRVKQYNIKNPKNPVETPKEARDKYLATGYIPQYIKHDDL